MIPFLVLILAGLLPGDPGAPPEAALARGQQPEPTYLLRADRVLTGAGESIEHGAVLIRAGRIVAVGADLQPPAGATELRLRGVLAPGMVDAFASMGAAGGLSEESRISTPELAAADGLDYSAVAWDEWLAHGVTTVHLVPDQSKPTGIPVATGWSATVLTAGEGARLGQARCREVFSLTRYSESREALGPTSLAGAAEHLEELLRAGIPGLARHGGLFFVDSAESVRLARAAAEGAGFQAGWLVAGDPAEFGGLLAGDLIGVPALAGGDWSLRTAETWKRLRASGARLAFGSYFGVGDLGDLRRSAMAMARITGDADAALAAVTSAAADLAGDSSAGRLAPQARADMVLWSGHPLDATARVKAVMIGGRTVYSAGTGEDF